MTNIVGLNGEKLTADEVYDCEIGTLLLSHMVGCLIKKDDIVHKLILQFGDTQYEVRVPNHEVTPEIIKNCWTELLGNAFANHTIGKQHRGAISTIKAGL